MVIATGTRDQAGIISAVSRLCTSILRQAQDRRSSVRTAFLFCLIGLMHVHVPDTTLEITANSPCIGHCTTVLGDDVCRSCLRTFEEVSRWLEMSEEERKQVNRRIALLADKVTGSQVNS